MIDQIDKHLATFLPLFAMAIAGAYVAVEALLLSHARRQVKADLARYDEEHRSLEAKAQELEAVMADIERLTTQLDGLEKSKKKVGAEVGRLVQASRCFIHEIGRKEPGKTTFSFALKPKTSPARMHDLEVVFHRSIWTYRNVAEVWASDAGTAAMILRSVFSDKSQIAFGEDETPAAAGEREA